jgi:hypothetical protein
MNVPLSEVSDTGRLIELKFVSIYKTCVSRYVALVQLYQVLS